MSDEVDSTSQTKRTTEAKSRKNAKKVKTYHTTDWGDYNVNFLIPGTGGAQDVPSIPQAIGRSFGGSHNI